MDERLVPEDAVEESLQQHLGRYRFAKTHVRGRVVDVACGTGYGTAILEAVGVDLSMEALEHARSRQVRLVAADAQRMPFGTGSLDVVVSFETIEHLPDPGRFVADCLRVLKPGGLLLCSTPNRELWSPRLPKPANPHHVREFNPSEFVKILRPFEVDLHGQVLLGRGRAAAFEFKELSKRLLKSFLPVRRFRPASRKRLEELEPDPAFDVKPLAGNIPLILVAVARRPA